VNTRRGLGLCAAVVLGWLPPVPGLALGQARPPSARGLYVAVGARLVALRDDAASPLAYGGLGGWFEIGIAGASVGADLHGTVTKLSSTLTDGNRPRERDIRLGLGLTVLRPVSSGVRLGGRLDARLSGRFHYYGDPAFQRAVFMFGTATLGPVAEWVTTIGSGRVTVVGALPLAGIALRPWSDARLVLRAGQGPRFVTFPKLLAASARVEWTPRVNLPWRVGYRLDLVRYHDPLRFRSVAQGFYAGFAPGGRRP